MCPKPSLSYCAAAMEPSRVGGGPTRSQDSRLKGSQGCPCGLGRLQPGRASFPSSRLPRPSPETPPLPHPQRLSHLLLTPISWPSPPRNSSPPPARPSSSPHLPGPKAYWATLQKTQEGPRGPQIPSPIPEISALPTPPALGHSPGLEKGWILGWASEGMGCGSLLASFSHLSDGGGNVGPVPGTGDTAVTETGRGSAHSQPAQERPSPEPSVVTFTGLH